jgi:hypothetical protein
LEDQSVHGGYEAWSSKNHICGPFLPLESNQKPCKLASIILKSQIIPFKKSSRLCKEEKGGGGGGGGEIFN